VLKVIPGAASVGAPTPDRSNERADVARRILELSETISQAIDYMLDKTEYEYGRDSVIVGSVSIVSSIADSSVGASSNAGAGLLKDVCEGLISLDNAVKAVSEPLGADPENIERIVAGYNALTERLDAMADAVLENRSADLPLLGGLLRDSFNSYSTILTQCFRKSAIM
jgi:hypothetical protein